MSWSPFSASASASNESSNKTSTINQNTTQNYSGTQTPILSPQFNTAYGNASGNLGLTGATPDQQTGLNYVNNFVTNNPNGAATTTANDQLSGIGGQMGGIATQYNNWANSPYFTLASLNSSGNPAYATPSAANAPTITAETSASAMDPYKQFYDQNLIDPSLKAFDYGTGRAYSALDARQAGSGAFAGDRGGLAYSDLGTQTALQRGQLEAQLKNLGLTNASGLATGDVSRKLGADTTNAGNILNANEYNATLANNRQQFDVNTAIQQRSQKDSELQAAAGVLKDQAGISQSVLNNIITSNGINLEAAQGLFQAGQITQQQLITITQLAAQTNGQSSQGDGSSTTNGTQNTTGNTSTIGAKVGIG
jgi:hypothetical protein